MKKPAAGIIVWIMALLVAAAFSCPRAGASETFSQYPGFAQYFSAHPRGLAPPTAEEQALLERWRPHLWVGPDQEGPLDFYADYIAHGRLLDGQGNVISHAVTPDLLNHYREDPAVEFVHEPAPGPVTALAFGRIDREPMLDRGAFTYLTYHFVFRHSGLAAGLGWWQAAAAGLAGDLEDWHQLDHYTAVTVALDPGGRFVGLILMQHNGLRAYWAGDVAAEADGRLRLCAAIRSNELYPCETGRERHRVVPFMSPDTIPYLVTGERRPWMSAEDLTEPVREVSYRLAFPPAADAFYSFAGWLGEHRRLPGRDGPPGADYYAPPEMLSRSLQLAALHWRENDREQMSELLSLLASGSQADWNKLAAKFRNFLDNARPLNPPAPERP